MVGRHSRPWIVCPCAPSAVSPSGQCAVPTVWLSSRSTTVGDSGGTVVAGGGAGVGAGAGAGAGAGDGAGPDAGGASDEPPPHPANPTPNIIATSNSPRTLGCFIAIPARVALETTHELQDPRRP